MTRALIDGAAHLSTRDADLSAHVMRTPERALFALCEGVRASIALASLELYGLYTPGGGTLWSGSTLAELTRALNHAPNVTALSLASSRLSDALAEPLGALTAGARHLRELNLSANDGLGSAFAQSLERALANAACRLRKLDVSNLPALAPRAAWAPGLGRLIAANAPAGSLTSLRASVHPANVADVLRGVAHNPRLTAIALTHARLPLGVLLNEIARPLSRGGPCAHIRELDLTHAYVGDAGASLLASTLLRGAGASARGSTGGAHATYRQRQCSQQEATSPTAARSPGRGVAAGGASQVGGPRDAGLTASYVAAVGGAAAAATEPDAPHGLQRLVLAHCAIYAQGGIALVDALATNRSLSELDLTANPLGDQFARALATLLADAPRAEPLRVVALTRTFVSDAGVEQLADAVRTNTRVTSLGSLVELPALIAKRRQCEQQLAENMRLARRASAPDPVGEAMVLLPAHEADLRMQVLALRTELRQAELARSGGADALERELEGSVLEAARANALLEATVARNRQLRERCTALELQLERARTHEAGPKRGARERQLPRGEQRVPALPVGKVRALADTPQSSGRGAERQQGQAAGARTHDDGGAMAPESPMARRLYVAA